MEVWIEFDGKRISKPYTGTFEGNIAPAPSSAEVLREIAGNLQGDDPMRAAFAGILLRAAEDLDRIRERTIEECALAAWKRGTEENEPGTTINRRVLTGIIVDNIRAMLRGDAPQTAGD
jgi:hypothetical protein